MKWMGYSFISRRSYLRMTVWSMANACLSKQGISTTSHNGAGWVYPDEERCVAMLASRPLWEQNNVVKELFAENLCH